MKLFCLIILLILLSSVFYIFDRYEKYCDPFLVDQMSDVFLIDVEVVKRGNNGFIDGTSVLNGVELPDSLVFKRMETDHNRDSQVYSSELISAIIVDRNRLDFLREYSGLWDFESVKELKLSDFIEASIRPYEFESSMCMTNLNHFVGKAWAFSIGLDFKENIPDKVILRNNAAVFINEKYSTVIFVKELSVNRFRQVILTDKGYGLDNTIALALKNIDG